MSSVGVDIERERARVKREAANDFAIQGFSMIRVMWSMSAACVDIGSRASSSRPSSRWRPKSRAGCFQSEALLVFDRQSAAAGAEALLGAGPSSGLIGRVLGKRLRERQAEAAADRASRKNSPRVEAVARTERR